VTLYYSHPECLEHRMQPQHPERPARLQAIAAALHAGGQLSQLQLREAPEADLAMLGRGHAAAYLAHLERVSPGAGLVHVDPDTALGPRSLAAARRAAGAGIAAVRAILAGEDQRAFCAVRPPGHHAEESSAMGFCVYGNVALAALEALAHPGIERVAILDFDVHHGNGTVDICRGRPEVLVCSSFQHPFYPGRLHDLVQPNIVNTPLPEGSDGSAFRRAIDATWAEAIARHRPQFVFVSAGFDAHRDDPLGGLALDESDFSWITRRICDWADSWAGGRIVSMLEGGYDLQALARSTVAHVDVLLGR
jgi:acetoin utilization deacetylase AcuC-like enzyme